MVLTLIAVKGGGTRLYSVKVKSIAGSCLKTRKTIKTMIADNSVCYQKQEDNKCMPIRLVKSGKVIASAREWK